MFTGIITEVGIVDAVEDISMGRRFRVAAPYSVSDAVVGDSIAVNGVCLTATRIDQREFECEAVAETLARTTLSDIDAGSRVNLERPMAAGGRFDGHIVQGHVDGVGQVRSIGAEGSASRIRFTMADELAKYVVEKGSIAVDGTSLTVTGVSAPGEAAWFEVVLIPHTLDQTVLGDRQVGQRVNLELDVFAKYVERITEMSR